MIECCWESNGSLAIPLGDKYGPVRPEDWIFRGETQKPG